ncbi:unnamed protein product [Closterium sp. Yama58-4]|nr:unnamed protein product [Closterium sp. Yama58-4]
MHLFKEGIVPKWEDPQSTRTCHLIHGLSFLAFRLPLHPLPPLPPLSLPLLLPLSPPLPPLHSLYNNVTSAATLPPRMDMHLFKEGIVPKWEDPQCEKGGSWTVFCRTKDMFDNNVVSVAQCGECGSMW